MRQAGRALARRSGQRCPWPPASALALGAGPVGLSARSPPLPVTYQVGRRLLLQLLHHFLVLPLALILLMQVPEPCELELHAHPLQLHLNVALSPRGPQGPGQFRKFRSIPRLALGGRAGFGGQRLRWPWVISVLISFHLLQVVVGRVWLRALCVLGLGRGQSRDGKESVWAPPPLPRRALPLPQATMDWGVGKSV